MHPSPAAKALTQMAMQSQQVNMLQQQHQQQQQQQQQQQNPAAQPAAAAAAAMAAGQLPYGYSPQFLAAAGAPSSVTATVHPQLLGAIFQAGVAAPYAAGLNNETTQLIQQHYANQYAQLVAQLSQRQLAAGQPTAPILVPSWNHHQRFTAEDIATMQQRPELFAQFLQHPAAVTSSVPDYAAAVQQAAVVSQQQHTTTPSTYRFDMQQHNNPNSSPRLPALHISQARASPANRSDQHNDNSKQRNDGGQHHKNNNSNEQQHHMQQHNNHNRASSPSVNNNKYNSPIPIKPKPPISTPSVSNAAASSGLYQPPASHQRTPQTTSYVQLSRNQQQQQVKMDTTTSTSSSAASHHPSPHTATSSHHHDEKAQQRFLDATRSTGRVMWKDTNGPRSTSVPSKDTSMGRPSTQSPHHHHPQQQRSTQPPPSNEMSRPWLTSSSNNQSPNRPSIESSLSTQNLRHLDPATLLAARQQYKLSSQPDMYTSTNEVRSNSQPPTRYNSPDPNSAAAGILTQSLMVASRSPYPQSMMENNNHSSSNPSTPLNIASSKKIWQPPVLSADKVAPPSQQQKDAAKNANAPKKAQSTPYTVTPRTPTSYTYAQSVMNQQQQQQQQQQQKEVYDITSLKYNPSQPPQQTESLPVPSASTAMSQLPKKRYTAELKPTYSLHHDVQPVKVKYLHDARQSSSKSGSNSYHQNHDDSGNNQPRYLEDGSVARILTQSESKVLYHFQPPVSAAPIRPSVAANMEYRAKESIVTAPVVANGHNYKLIQLPPQQPPQADETATDLTVKKRRFDTPTPTSSSPAVETPVTPRKRASQLDQESADASKKQCVEKDDAADKEKEEARQPDTVEKGVLSALMPADPQHFRNAMSQSSQSSDLPADMPLQLAAMGMFSMRQAHWHQRGAAGFPGTPSKNDVKNALLSKGRDYNMQARLKQQQAQMTSQAAAAASNEGQKTVAAALAVATTSSPAAVPPTTTTVVNNSTPAPPSAEVVVVPKVEVPSPTQPTEVVQPTPATATVTSQSPPKVVAMDTKSTVESSTSGSSGHGNTIATVAPVKSAQTSSESTTAMGGNSGGSGSGDSSSRVMSSNSTVVTNNQQQRPVTMTTVLPTSNKPSPVQQQSTSSSTTSSSSLKIKNKWLDRMDDENRLMNSNRNVAVVAPMVNHQKRKFDENNTNNNDNNSVMTSPTNNSNNAMMENSNANDHHHHRGGHDEDHEMDDLGEVHPPHKKSKKNKHRDRKEGKKMKDATRKKRRHKNSRKSDTEVHSEASTDTSATSPREKKKIPSSKATVHMRSRREIYDDDFEEEFGKFHYKSKSRRFVEGHYVEHTYDYGDESEDEGDDEFSGDESNSKKKRKIGCMFPPDQIRPIGENGLPKSILMCKKDVMRLRMSGDSFIQDAPCYELGVSKGMNGTSSNNIGMVSRCRECRNVKRREGTGFCRFYWFRKISFSNNQLQTAGFWEPEDSKPRDLSLWLPKVYPQNPVGTLEERERRIPDHERPKLSIHSARYIMSYIRSTFCKLVQEERDTFNKLGKTKIYWKRPVTGVREMCDACETTVFNLHFTCNKCGFAVCCECYLHRLGNMSKEDMESFDANKDNTNRWLRCIKGKYHSPQQLMPTQLIPSSCLFDMSDLVHESCKKSRMENLCDCLSGEESSDYQQQNESNSDKKITLRELLEKENSGKEDPLPLLKTSFGIGESRSPVVGNRAEIRTKNMSRLKSYDNFHTSSSSPLDWLASIALREQRVGEAATPATTTPSNANNQQQQTNSNNQVDNNGSDQQQDNNSSASSDNENTSPPSGLNGDSSSTHTSSASSISSHQSEASGVTAVPGYREVPLEYFCDDDLLNLKCTGSHQSVLSVFQSAWNYGAPVLTSGADKSLTLDLWHPNRMDREHGSETTGTSLINCREGTTLRGYKISDFWKGFESIRHRLKDSDGNRMILKLKDWPTSEDFLDKMPQRFKDVMQALPLSDYTSREGRYNIANNLPEFFVRPDLGPKMYIAYGWVTEKNWSSGTTNLHLDISDACNIMVYVGVPDDEPAEASKTMMDIMKEGDIDETQMRRIQKNKPGALWHIFRPEDTPKIRKFMKQLIREQNLTMPPDHDPIHDQLYYLDKEKRRRLLEEYGVKSYAFVQCQGDSVMIPAGAPHQVFNLHSCIKVAEDFVSPEHVDVCYKLTNEFRKLSSSHANHEDKLQLKNILYHTMKEVMSAYHYHEYLHKGIST